MCQPASCLPAGLRSCPWDARHPAPCQPPPPQPTFEVLAVAVNSGLAAYPTGYTRIWAGAGGAIWRPVPPPGYVAAGDLFTDGEDEPGLSAMVCVHGEPLL